jgi:ATP-binding cassette subfamily F protein 2
MYICNILGKSTLMNVIANREIPVPAHIDIFHLSNEMPSSEKTALECVVEVNDERARLEREAEMLTSEGDQGSERL